MMVLIDLYWRTGIYYLFKLAIGVSPLHINICASWVYCLPHSQITLKSSMLFSVQMKKLFLGEWRKLKFYYIPPNALIDILFSKVFISGSSVILNAVLGILGYYSSH